MQVEARILDAPNIRDDYYTNLMDWGKNNILAVALGSEMYLWNSENGKVLKLFKATNNDYPASVAWSEDTKFVGIGFMHSKLQLWDAETSKPVCTSLLIRLLCEQQVVIYCDSGGLNF